MSEENTPAPDEQQVAAPAEGAAPTTPTPEQALNTLAAAARQARLTYDEHAAVDGCARVLAELVQGAPAE
ncbi:MAG TPA: hypothetical protein EYN93_08790 [Planctomycetaceae bacterium]|nr:hypothetical protein [Planctomycetaceae bacterium]